MIQKRIPFLLLVVGLLLVSASVFLMTAVPASAQCGTQTSSCKNCHEKQAQDPVNNDGTAWHTDHAFGDYCYSCHAGNSVATEKDVSHQGMVAPLSDVVANCKSCHLDDYLALAEIYAADLGTQVGTGAGTSQLTLDLAAPTAGTSATEAVPSGVVLQPTEMIDYVQLYEETAQQAQPVNWGNIIGAVVFAALLAGGALLVIQNERRRHGRIKPKGKKTEVVLDLKDYPKEVLALLPKMNKLNPVGRRALQTLLDDPDTTSDMLYRLSKLDPDLIRRFKALDREAQALLLALARD